MLKSKFVLFISLIIFPILSINSLDIIRGHLKLVLHEKSGKFSLYNSDEITNPVFYPLFVAEDPKTTTASIKWLNQTFQLGSSADFQLKTESTNTGARFIWTSRWLDIIQSFEFITSVNSTLVDGIRIHFDFLNKADRTVDGVGLRFILDTYLGESRDHFRLSTGEFITSEIRLSQVMPESVQSFNNQNKNSPGLLLMLSGQGVTTPGQVLFANWKRMEEADWIHSYRGGRDFNLMPYSFNDSAIAMYFENFSLLPGIPARVTLTMGNRSAITFVGAITGTANVVGEVMDASKVQTLTFEQIQSQLKIDNQMIVQILEKINGHIQGSVPLENKELLELEATLLELESRRILFQTNP